MNFLPVNRREGIPIEQAHDMLQAGWNVSTGVAVQTHTAIATPDNPNPAPQVTAMDLWTSPQDSMVPAGMLARAIYEITQGVDDEGQLAIINELCTGLFGQSLETLRANFEKVLSDGNADGDSIQERSRRAYAMGDTQATDPEPGAGTGEEDAGG